MIPRLEEILPLIHQRMAEMNYTQEDVGRLLGLGQTGVSRRLSGKTLFKLSELARLLPTLGILTQEDMGTYFLSFPRLALATRVMAKSSHKQMATALRAMADDLDASTWDGQERRDQDRRQRP